MTIFIYLDRRGEMETTAIEMVGSSTSKLTLEDEVIEKLIVEFEKSLEEYHQQTGRVDFLVGFGRIMAEELRKAQSANVTLGQLLADFYAEAQQREERAALRTQHERFHDAFHQPITSS